MDTRARGQAREGLEARRDAIAERWYRAVAGTGFVPLSPAEVRERLAGLIDRIVAALLAEPLDRLAAREIGADLARLYYVHPNALSGTQEVLGAELLAELPPEQAAALWPRVATLLAELAAGYLAQLRATILTEQESIRKALLVARERAEEALRASEARFRAIFDAAAIGMGIGDMQGHILATNPALQAMLGYSAEEFRAMTVAQFMHPEDAASVWRLYRELTAGLRDHFQVEKRYLRKDGRLVWTNLTVSLVRDAFGQPEFQIAMIEDITERKQAEETVRQLNADLERRVVERTAQLAALNRELEEEIARREAVEAERLALLANEQAARATAEAAQRRLAFLAEASRTLATSLDYKTTLASLASLAVPDLADWCAVYAVTDAGAIEQVAVAHVDQAKEDLVQALQGGSREASAECLVRRVLETGEAVYLPEVTEAQIGEAVGCGASPPALLALRPASLVIVPLLARRQAVGAITLARAVAEERYTPEDLALAQDLARRAAMAIDNARLYQEAQRALASRDEFLSVAAHELKTPVTSIRGFTELALQQLAKPEGPSLERVGRMLQTLERESKRLSHLVSQLLDVSRIEAGQLALSRVPTDVARLVREAAQVAQLGTTQHTIRVRAAEPVEALVDPLRLEQVVTNLLSNAVKYSPRGGPIDVEVERADGGTVLIAVRDRGVGIPEGQWQRIFERFYQARPDDAASGMGLGLYISQRIVQLHGGSMAVEAPPGGGSRFVVRLPIA